MPLSLSPEQRALRARLGGLATASRHDVRAITAPARAAFEERFYRDLPPDLIPEERERRAEAARRLYFTRLAYRSALARSRRNAASGRRTPTTEPHL